MATAQAISSSSISTDSEMLQRSTPWRGPSAPTGRRRSEHIDRSRSRRRPSKKSRVDTSSNDNVPSNDLDQPLPQIVVQRPTPPRRNANRRPAAANNADPAALPNDAHFLPSIELNNIGCDLLESSLLDAATATVKVALESLHRGVMIVNSAATGAADEESARQRRVLSRQNEMEVMRAKMNLRGSSGNIRIVAARPSTTEADSLIYKTPVRLSAPRIQGVTLSKQLIAAVALYNLALAHHLSGSAHGNRDLDLNRAIELYRMAEGTLLKAVEAGTQQTDTAAVSRFLAKAILNNLGQICLVGRGNVEWATQYFDGLREICAQEEREAIAGGLRKNGNRVGMDPFAFNALVAGGMNTAPTA